MKIILITDTHWGIRNDSLISHNYIKKFLDEVFWPTLAREDINTVIHLGDLVDRRKYINYLTAKRLRNDFLDPLMTKGIDLHIIAGNHDTFYKNTNEVNALEELLSYKYHNVEIYIRPTEVNIGGIDMLLLPWICDDNRDASLKAINSSKSSVVMGHLELNGFEMYRGHVSDHGDDPKIFDKFDVVCSGHYHTKSNNSNINYLGAPVQFTWSDYNDPKGFHIFDTDTRELTFIVNPYTIFHKVFYDDLNIELDTITNIDFNQYQGSYIKVIIRNKTNPYWFDIFIDRLEKAGVIDLQIVEDHFHLDLEQDDDIVNEAEDTVTILNKYIDGLNSNVDSKKLKSIFYDLYNEALTLE